MASSTITGIGSGFDTQGIVKALVAAERAPKDSQILKQQTTATTQLSAVGTVKVALETYRAALTKLNTATSFSGLTGTSSEEKTAKVTIDDAASTGKYQLEVTQLATAAKVSSAVFAGGSSAKVNPSDSATTLTISQSDKDYNVSIPAGATMQEAREAINTQLESKGISANVLSDAKGARLVITSTDTGEGSDITLSGESELAKGFTTGDPPQNAKFKIDGFEMESKSNKVTAAISGVTLELNRVDKDPITINVGVNNDTLKTSVQSFVSAYNALMTTINAQTKVTATGDASTTTAGALTGDASMRQLVNSMRGELVQGSGSFNVMALSQMGITTDQKTGLLSLEDKAWNKAMEKNSGDVSKVFLGKDGLISRMNKSTESYVGSTGLLATRSNDINTKLTDLTKQKLDLDRRMDSMQTALSAKYTAMDTMIAKINAGSSSIMTTLNALNNPKSS